METRGKIRTRPVPLSWDYTTLNGPVCPIYPPFLNLSLASGPRQANYINTSGMGVNSLVPEDGSVFEMLNEIIQHEPKELFGAEQLGRLATLGIVKGKPFNPDARMRRIWIRGPNRGRPCAGLSCMRHASRTSNIGRIAIGKKCFCTTPLLSGTGSMTSMPVPSGTTRQSLFHPT